MSTFLLAILGSALVNGVHDSSCSGQLVGNRSTILGCIEAGVLVWASSSAGGTEKRMATNISSALFETCQCETATAAAAAAAADCTAPACVEAHKLCTCPPSKYHLTTATVHVAETWRYDQGDESTLLGQYCVLLARPLLCRCLPILSNHAIQRADTARQHRHGAGLLICIPFMLIGAILMTSLPL